jgi:hypothetical protein
MAKRKTRKICYKRKLGKGRSRITVCRKRGRRKARK